MSVSHDVPKRTGKARAWALIVGWCRRHQFWFVAVPFFCVLAGAFWFLCKHYDGSEPIKPGEALEALALWVAVPALLAVLYQTRHISRWHSVRAYHEFFSDFPTKAARDDLQHLLDASEVKFPTLFASISKDDLLKLVNGAATLNKTGADQERNALQCATAYLDDFEAFSCAVLNGVCDEDYAYQIEGTRVLVAYFGFSQLIERCRELQNTNLNFLASNGVKVECLRSKCYEQLEELAKRWISRRIDHDANLDKKARELAIGRL